jgi:lysine-specific histone demethylase 1
MTDGVLGLSSSSISLPSQLSQKGLMRNVIAHCIPGDGSEGGYLLMGDKLLPSKGITWASLIGKPAR